MAKKMMHLIFPQRLIKKPVIYTMAKKFRKSEEIFGEGRCKSRASYRRYSRINLGLTIYEGGHFALGGTRQHHSGRAHEP